MRILSHISFLIILFFIQLAHTTDTQKKVYKFSNDPIDIVIPSLKRDREQLKRCIKGVRKNIKNVRRIIVVSKEKLTNEAEWFPEANYPFSKEGMILEIFNNSAEEAAAYIYSAGHRSGWIYQQCLKLYAPFVIPGISRNVLILDSDTIFLNPAEFTDSKGAGLYNYGTEYHKLYFGHGARLIPGFEKILPDKSGICHHMLFQREILEDLFKTVEEHHGVPFWRAFCRCINKSEAYQSSASEYEIYFNFMLSRTDQCTLRPLRWKNMALPKHFRLLQDEFHYISCHYYLKPKAADDIYY